ncbi:hypothetical protein [Helicobacter cinaedi]|uniref:hypothetical protein n=1 Tax=Helicobacter cinaedi TaxID=213 RepID=UPI000D7D05A1|nr:hypothetical protein [Helicobacter cinaedi]
MTLIIENVKDEFLPAYTELVKNTNATIITQHDKTREVQDAIAEFEAEQREGKTKRYKNFEEFEKAMEA